jgi:hypothetical protein
MSLIDLVKRYDDVKTKRLSLEKEADAIKAGEETELKQAILNELTAQGLKSANVEGVGRIAIRTTSHYEVADANLLAKAFVQQVVANSNNGRPLADGMLLQARPSREGLDTLLEGMSDTDKEKTMSLFGVRFVERNDLSLTH